MGFHRPSGLTPSHVRARRYSDHALNYFRIVRPGGAERLQTGPVEAKNAIIMPIPSSMRVGCLSLLFLLVSVLSSKICTAATDVAADALDPAEFSDPPITARPGAFWPWLNGHVSLERITYELEQMKDKGMSGADIWDVRAQINPGDTVPVGPPFLG